MKTVTVMLKGIEKLFTHFQVWRAQSFIHLSLKYSVGNMRLCSHSGRSTFRLFYYCTAHSFCIWIQYFNYRISLVWARNLYSSFIVCSTIYAHGTFCFNATNKRHAHKPSHIIVCQKINEYQQFSKKARMFTSRFADLWRNYKMPQTMSKSSYQRLKGAYLGYNSFGDSLEYRPEAQWGNVRNILHAMHTIPIESSFSTLTMNLRISMIC